MIINDPVEFIYHYVILVILCIFVNIQLLNSGLDYSELAYDWVTNNLYWSDPYLDIIEVVSLTTLHRSTILSVNVTNVKGLSLDPRNG